ncbi:putative glutamine synthetase [Luminiphilus syltensis NOR5-1B]|uniref:Putative glutamine synthetase n=1 Tax=Luminiphilus syltensis NOR5-1B TaxID=565045 RepID=B8KTU5_9GAMM|nr:putative glutamine synthetase [Luminiphilus syltensis NOR5-1B]
MSREEKAVFAQPEELEAFIGENPDIELLELLMPDMHGLLRCKRIQRSEFAGLFEGKFTVPITIPLLGIRGDLYDGLDLNIIGGDPDQLLRPISGTLARVPWLDSPTAQVVTGFANDDGSLAWMDPRSPLLSVLKRYKAGGLSPVVATELEFYLLENGDGPRPKPLTGRITGTGLSQQGIQYCMPDDLIDCEPFLEGVRKACQLHDVPLTAIHSEFSPGQWEINTHHQKDAILAASHAPLLRRIVKCVARQHGYAATFMAKPFADIAGSGMHIHASVYNASGDNIFADIEPGQAPIDSPTLRAAVGGLAEAVNESMAIFAPNVNSYRRFTRGEFAPSRPSWGYDHREVALRIPASDDKSRRIEHRISGADTNPYLVVAAVLAGIHHGITTNADPGPPAERSTDFTQQPVTLPQRLDAALEMFRNGKILPAYLGEQYCQAFATLRQGECDDYHSQIPDLDYQWYLRAL